MAFPQLPAQSVIAEATGRMALVWNNWFERVQKVLFLLTNSGSGAGYPTQDLYIGCPYFDTDRGQWMVWTGSEWRSTAAGFYGTFYDNTDQSAANTTTAYPVNSSKVTFPYSGVYNIQFSIQFISTENNANNPSEVNVWLRKNGSDVAESNSQFTVPNRHGSHSGALIAALNLVIDLADGDYIQLMWQTENTLISMQTLPAGTTPTTPVTPSVILTATEV
jgi:hypothetical protein